MVLGDFLGLFVSLKELLLLPLSLLNEGLSVEVGVFDGEGLVSPLFDVLVVEGGLDWVVATLLPGLKLLRVRCLA